MDSNTTHNKGFKVPEGYFENNKTELLSTIKSELHDIDNKAFKVPESYFDNSKIDILNTIKGTKKKPKVISLFSKRIIMGIAASFLLLIAMTFINQNTNTKNNEVVTEQLKDPLLNQKEGIKYSLPLSKKDKMLAIFVEDNTSDDLIEDFLLEDEIASTTEDDF